MDNSLEPTASLPVRLAAKLRDDIRRGQWPEKLPGCRSLAEHYGVSRKTCDATLKILENAKVIAPSQSGKRRQIIAAEPKLDSSLRNSKRGTLLVLHSSTQTLSARHLSNLNVVQSLWNEAGGNAAFHIVDYERYRKPKEILHRLIERYHATAFVLIAPRTEWLIEAAEMLPTYSMGGLWPEGFKNATAHGFDFCHQIDQLVTFLYECGHRRMMIPNYHESPLAEHFQAAVEAGFRRFQSKAKADDSMAFNIPNFFSNDPKEWFKFWRDSLKRYEPTVVIAVQTIHLQSLYGFCRATRISIPSDLSVICTEHSIQAEWMWPKPHMTVHSEAAVRKCFKQWIDGGLRPTGMKEISLTLVEGDSVRTLDTGGPPTE